MTLANTDQGTGLPGITAFMLVKTRPAWVELGFEGQLKALQIHIEPILQKSHEQVRLLMYDVDHAYSGATDIWVWEARDRAALQTLIEALRATPFWGIYFDILDVLEGARGDAIFQLDSWKFRVGVPVFA